MPPKNQLTGARRERKDPTEELKELAQNDKMSDEELQPLVRQALDDGADVNAKVGNVPVLHLFIDEGKISCVQEMLFRKPPLSDVVNHAIAASLPESKIARIVQLMMFCWNSGEKLPFFSLQVAIQHNYRLVVKELLRAKPELTYALAHAANFCRYGIACDLIKAGAPIEGKCFEDGSTPLLVAAEVGSLKIVQVLLEAGANVKATCKSGNTALHLAARNGNAEICELLIKHGARVNAYNLSYETPTCLAALAKHLDVAAILKNAGATYIPSWVLDNLIAQNQISMFKLLAEAPVENDVISSAVELEGTEILEFLLENRTGDNFTVEIAQELQQKSQNDQIKNLLQKWINKKLGIVEVKKEEIGEEEEKPKKGGRPKKK